LATDVPLVDDAIDFTAKQKQPLAMPASGCRKERRRRVELPTSSLGS
jgi:hypothetical protein